MKGSLNGEKGEKTRASTTAPRRFAAPKLGERDFTIVRAGPVAVQETRLRSCSADRHGQVFWTCVSTARRSEFSLLDLDQALKPRPKMGTQVLGVTRSKRRYPCQDFPLNLETVGKLAENSANFSPDNDHVAAAHLPCEFSSPNSDKGEFVVFRNSTDENGSQNAQDSIDEAQQRRNSGDDLSREFSSISNLDTSDFRTDTIGSESSLPDSDSTGYGSHGSNSSDFLDDLLVVRENEIDQIFEFGQSLDIDRIQISNRSKSDGIYGGSCASSSYSSDYILTTLSEASIDELYKQALETSDFETSTPPGSFCDDSKVQNSRMAQEPTQIQSLGSDYYGDSLYETIPNDSKNVDLSCLLPPPLPLKPPPKRPPDERNTPRRVKRTEKFFKSKLQSLSQSVVSSDANNNRS